MPNPDKFTNMPPKIMQCLIVMFSPSATDGERINAMHIFDEYLAKTLRSDAHELKDRITMPPVSDEDMQRVFDAGREQGRSESTVTAAPKAFSNTNSFGGVGRSSYSFGDSDRIEGDDVHNGYSWSTIAAHCYANLTHIPAQHHGFLEDMADRLTGYGSVSGKQAKYLGNLINRFLQGRI